MFTLYSSCAQIAVSVLCNRTHIYSTLILVRRQGKNKFNSLHITQYSVVECGLTHFSTILWLTDELIVALDLSCISCYTVHELACSCVSLPRIRASRMDCFGRRVRAAECMK
jgi:hypothetical protein